MNAIACTVIDARSAAQTASPAITFRLVVDNLLGGRIHMLALRCQVRIDARQRQYTGDEEARLYELFGDRSQWDRTLHSVTWAQPSMVTPSFDRQIEVNLPVACTYDLEVAAAKYLHAVRTGEIPLTFLFSGTVLRAGEAGSAFFVEPIPWDLEASYQMPVAVWQTAMNQFFPGGGWLRVQRETIDRLQAFRGQHAVVSWDEAIDLLLQRADERQPV